MFDASIKTNEYASIVVTHECNKKCPFCIDNYRCRKEFITIDNVKNACNDAKLKNIKDILIVGGEPTLHPLILKIAVIIKSFGFNTILTTNYTNPKIIKLLDGIIDNFNISYYNQKNLPKQIDFKSDITISCLIHKKQLNTQKKLDLFIEKYKSYGHLKFSTLVNCNAWTNKNYKIDYIDNLPSKQIILFNEIIGQIYKNKIIKRYDKVVNKTAEQSIKYHVDGSISTGWKRQI